VTVSCKAPGQQTEASRDVRIVLVGDTMLGRGARLLLRRFGYGFPLRRLKECVKDHDLLIGNLEGPITAYRAPINPNKEYLYRMDPRAAAALADFGFDSLCLANNHAYDHGDMGHLDTVKALEQSGIGHFGTGRNLAEAEAGRVVTVGGMRIGLLGLMEPYGSYADKYDYFATESDAGVAPLNETVASRAIQDMRSRADLVIVWVHWGQNYEGVTEQQRRWARKLAEWGADVVVGHHSHVAQAVEIIDGVPVLHALGNFAFCTRGRFDEAEPHRRYGWVATVVADEQGVKRVELVAIATDNAVVFFEPRPVGSTILQRVFEQINKPFGTKAEFSKNKAVIPVRESPAEQPKTPSEGAVH